MTFTALLLGTPAQPRAVMATRGNETREACCRSAETFRETAPVTLEPCPKRSWWSWRSEAWAEEGDRDEPAIRELFDRYSAALSARNVDQVAALQPGLTEASRQKLAAYFDFAQDLKVRISDINLLRKGDEAVATFRRQDEFTDQKSGRRFALEAVRSATLRRAPDDGWNLVGLGG
jgi:hypothetical protein